MRIFICLFGLLLAGCTGVPEQVRPVDNIDLERYMGKWYEIARLDHAFERGLSQVSATYRLRDDGAIHVVNRGYAASTGEWDEAVGKAYPNGKPGEGRLKVSFFGPFYSGYNIIALDTLNYSYAMVCGPNHSYLWILAREREIDATTLDALIAQARAAGFATEGLIMVEHKE